MCIRDRERTGYRQEYTASADAMGDKYDVFSSFGYLNEKGYIIAVSYTHLDVYKRQVLSFSR